LWTHLQKKHPDKEQHDGKTLREYYDEFTQGLSISQQELKLQLLEAANEGDTAKVRELRSAEVDESVVDKIGRTPLDLAVAQGHRETVALLWQNAAIANETLRKALNDSKQEVVEVLIESGVDINQLVIARSDGRRRTALYRAVLKKDEAMIHFLLNHGADINRRQPDDSHETALHHAARWVPEVTGILLEANADMEAKDDTGQTPLDCALERARGFEIIMSSGECYHSEYFSRGYFGRETIHLLLEAGAVFEQRHWDASPPSFREQYPQYAPSPAT
jgi:hypothetical protein